MERRACQKIQSCCLSFCNFSPPPHFRRIRGTFAHSSSPEPPYLVANIPPRSRQLVTYHCFLQNTHISRVFSGNLLETNAANVPPSPRKWEHTCDPLVYSSGGGGGTSKSLGVQNRLFLSEIGYIRLVYSSSIIKHYPLFLGEITNLRPWMS